MSTGAANNNSTAELARRQLLARHLSGDRAAFGEFMTCYETRIMSLVIRAGVEKSSADDLFQEIFLKIHLAADKYQSSLALDPWVFAVANNTIRSFFRRLKVRQIVQSRDDLEDYRQNDNSGDELDARETASWLEKEIAKLPEPQREVICLCGVKDLSQQDVAEILSMPINTVKTNLSRARASLAKALARRNAIIRREVSL